MAQWSIDPCNGDRHKFAGKYPDRASSAGIALIEFIVVAAPVALVIFFLIADFGRIMRLADELAFSARTGVERAYQSWTLGGGDLTSTVTDATRCAIRNSSNQCKYSSATVNVGKVCGCPDGTTLDCATVDVLGSAVRCTGYGLPQIEYTVEISFAFQTATPLISTIVGNSIVITRSASHRVQ